MIKKLINSILFDGRSSETERREIAANAVDKVIEENKDTLDELAKH